MRVDDVCTNVGLDLHNFFFVFVLKNQGKRKKEEKECTVKKGTYEKILTEYNIYLTRLMIYSYCTKRKKNLNFIRTIFPIHVDFYHEWTMKVLHQAKHHEVLMFLYQDEEKISLCL